MPIKERQMADKIVRAMDKVKALYLTRDLAAEERQMEIIYLAGKLLVGLYNKGEYALFNDFWKCLKDKADDNARSILQPMVKEHLHGEVAFGDEDIKEPDKGELENV